MPLRSRTVWNMIDGQYPEHLTSPGKNSVIAACDNENGRSVREKLVLHLIRSLMLAAASHVSKFGMMPHNCTIYMLKLVCLFHNGFL